MYLLLDLLLSKNKNEISNTLVYREEVMEQAHRMRSNKPPTGSHYHLYQSQKDDDA